MFSGLNSGGVKGIKLEKSNYVISQSILMHSIIDLNIRNEYLKYASDIRKNNNVHLRKEFNEQVACY